MRSNGTIKTADIWSFVTRAGETPQTVTLYAYADLVDSVRPGDRIEVSGIVLEYAGSVSVHEMCVYPF